jgi:hypothetical protein
MRGAGPPGDDDRDLPAALVRALERACDRFEAAWRPRPEDYLGEMPAAGRRALVRELLLLDVALRRERGERPTAAEYRGRFPGHGALIDAALRAAPSSTGAARARRRPPGPDPPRQAGLNLLFGVLALQNDFIGRDDLLGAFAAWVADKARPLAQLLVDRGALDAAHRALLEALVAEHLKQHGGDPAASLAAVSSLGPVRDDLERLDDAALRAGLAATASRPAWRTVLGANAGPGDSPGG